MHERKNTLMPWVDPLNIAVVQDHTLPCDSMRSIYSYKIGEKEKKKQNDEIMFATVSPIREERWWLKVPPQIPSRQTRGLESLRAKPTFRYTLLKSAFKALILPIATGRCVHDMRVTVRPNQQTHVCGRPFPVTLCLYQWWFYPSSQSLLSAGILAHWSLPPTVSYQSVLQLR